jgi:N-methylhydantoinase A/oxoprolinase/acetone carboxylase beta subunit
MSNNPGQAQFEVCVSDTGGTFTDTFIVGSNDDFVAAKQV